MCKKCNVLIKKKKIDRDDLYIISKNLNITTDCHDSVNRRLSPYNVLCDVIYL